MYAKIILDKLSLECENAEMNSLYFLEPLQEIIETSLLTSCIRDEVPVSLILVGPSGTAKSMSLARYESTHILHTDSFSSQGLFEIAANDKKGELRFLLVPDINPTMSRRSSTVQSATANLLSFTTDGTVRVDDGREVKEAKHAPVGIITAATNDMYDKQAKRWFALGLRRRIIPIFFRFSNETTRKLQALVRDDKIKSSQPSKISLDLNMSVRPAIHATAEQDIEKLSIKLAEYLGKLQAFEKQITKWYIREVVPISPQITLKNLARAHALRQKRAECNASDIDFVSRFVDFCDPEHPRQI